MKDSASERDVLIVTDPQVDFCPGGALAVPEGDGSFLSSIAWRAVSRMS